MLHSRAYPGIFDSLRQIHWHIAKDQAAFLDNPVIPGSEMPVEDFATSFQVGAAITVAVFLDTV